MKKRQPERCTSLLASLAIVAVASLTAASNVYAHSNA